MDADLGRNRFVGHLVIHAAVEPTAGCPRWLTRRLNEFLANLRMPSYPPLAHLHCQSPPNYSDKHLQEYMIYSQ